MRLNFLRRDLGLQLLALYLLFVGPVVLATLVFDRLASQRLEADVKAADLALARAIALETNTSLESALYGVRQLAEYPAVIASDPAGMEGLFRTVMSVRPDVNLIYRLDGEGIMRYHYPAGPGDTLGWDFSGRDYYQRALFSRSPLLSEGRISPTTQQAVATAVMPLWSSSGEFMGLVGTNLKLQSLSHTLAGLSRPEQGGASAPAFEVAIIDSAGQVIAHPSPPLLLTKGARPPSPVLEALFTHQAGSLILEDPGREESLYSFVPIPVAGWGVVVSRPTAAAFATPRSTHRAALFTVGVFLVVGLFFWFALSRQVIRPLERLAEFSQTIGLEEETPGDPSLLAREAGRRDQIGRLIHSLNRMEQAIQARLQELSTLLETSAAVVSTLDSQVVLNRILEQVERLMSIEQCAILALDEERGVFRAKASRGLSRDYTEKLAIDLTAPYSSTLQAIRSGQPVQISDTEADETYAPSRPRSRAEGYRSLLAVPLKTQHGPPSALLVYRPEPHEFTRSEINLLTSFANHAAMAIENALLFARSDMRLKEETRRLEALIQSLQEGLVLEDLHGRVLYANRRTGEWIDLPPEDLTGLPVQAVLGRLLSQAVDRDASQALIDSLMKGEGHRQGELVLEAPRSPRYLRLQVFDVTDSAGIGLGRGLILRDITQNRELDRMKSSLISTVSHELRTPLAAIKGYATTLLAEDVEWDASTQREFLGIIEQETDRLNRLVNDLLDMSRIEAGNLRVDKTACSLAELVVQARERSHPNPGERLEVNLPAGLPPLFADPQRIEVVLRNLIENAARYAGDDASICVSASLDHHQVTVRVEDDGPGIPDEHSQRIFESFYQMDSGLNRTAAGTGLGLAICQGFVRAHGGEIWLEPRARGTCIAFSLPLEAGKSV